MLRSFTQGGAQPARDLDWTGDMLAHRYKSWSWGNQRDDGQPDCIKFDVGVTTIAKRNLHQNYEVFNEVVGTELGRSSGCQFPLAW